MCYNVFVPIEDSPRDDLQIDSSNLELWSKQANSLMEQNKYQLSDQMNYTHRDQLLCEAERGNPEGLSSNEGDEELEKRLKAGKALIDD